MCNENTGIDVISVEAWDFRWMALKYPEETEAEPKKKSAGRKGKSK
jgi:hypothetical protein